MELLPSAVSKAISELPQVQVRHVGVPSPALSREADVQVDIDVQGSPLRLLVECKKNAYPRDVRAVIPQLSSYRNQCDDMQVVPMLVAPALPQSSRDLLRAEQIAYADDGGSLYLPWANGLFFIDRPVPRSAIRESLNIFKGNAARVLHVLLSKPGNPWHTVELADQAGVSQSTVHQVQRILQDQLWVDTHGAGPKRVRILREPGALLDAWREEHTLKQYQARSFYGWAASADALRTKFVEAIDAVGLKYALTLSSGAALVAPFVTNVQRLSILMPAGSGSESLWQSAALEPADDGANITILFSKGDTPLLLRREIDGVWVASDIQLYLDLWASPARGKEQAEHLRRERLGY